ncbi:MAG: translocation/assembly module TamB domain-containing protein [Acidobacteriota bacterium]
MGRLKRRPGRLRRWVLRPLLWGLAALCLLIFVLQQLINTRWARDGARQQIVERLSEALDRDIELVDLSFELLPLSVEIWGFSIAGPDPTKPKFIEIPWAAIDADLSALRNRRLHLREVRVQRPVIMLEYYPDRSHNMIKRSQGPPKPRRFDVFVDRLEVDRAEFGLDQQNIRLSLAADGLRARLRGVGEMHLAGQLDAHNILVRLPNATPLTVAVSARGTLQRGLIEIESARVTGPDLAIAATGVCEYPRTARERRNCLFQARGRTRGEALAELGYFQELRGPFVFDGSLIWRPNLTGWRSRVDADEVEVWGRTIEDFTGSLVADRFGMRIGVDEARYAEGTVSGSLDWQAKQEGKPWTVDLAFRELAADRVLFDQNIPSRGYASRIDGRFGYRFFSSQSGRGQGSAELELTPDAEHAGVPFAGSFPLRIETGIVRTDSARLRSERQSIVASGWYDLLTRQGDFDYEITSADLAELMPLLPLDASLETPLWLPTAGRGELEGTLYVRPDPQAPDASSVAPTGAGGTSADLRVRLEDVVTPGLSAGTVSGGMHMTTDRAEALRLDLGNAGQALLMRGEVPYTPTAENRIELAMDAFDWPLDTARPWIDFELPASGPITGHLELYVDHLGSYGELEARVAPATLKLISLPIGETPAAEPVAGVPADLPALLTDVDSLAGTMVWDLDQMRFERLDATAPSGTLSGAGTLDWSTGAIELKLASPSLQIGEAPLAAYLPRADIRGEVAVQGHLAGRFQQPSLDLVVEADELALGSRRLQGRPSRLEVEWHDGRATVEGQLLDLVTVAGGGLLNNRRSDLAVDVVGSDLHGLAELMLESPPADLAGSFEGTLRVRGDDRTPATVDLDLGTLDIELGDRALSNLEPVRAQLDAAGVELASLHLRDAETDSEFKLTGMVDMTEPTALDLDLLSTMSGPWLRLLVPGFEVEGNLALAGKVGGSLEQPTFDGAGELTDGRVVLSEDFPLELRELQGTMLFDPGHVAIERLEGRLGRGRVAVDGQATLATAGEPLIYRLQLSGDEIDLPYIEGWSVRGAVRMSLSSEGQGHLLDGRAELDTLAFSEDIRTDFAQLMRGFLQRQRLEVDPRDSVLSTIELNIDIEAPNAVSVRNNLAQLDGSAELLVRGNMAQPVLFGEVEIDPEGTLLYNSTDYQLERGRIVFANPYQLDPELDLVAVTRVREFDVTLAVDGTFERLNTRFSSEPPLPDLEVFRLLASGGDERTDTTLVAPQRTEVEEDPSTSAATFLYGQAASVIGQRVNSLFGFDKFRIDPLTGSGDQLSKARVTVGKRLSKDVFVTFSADPSSTEDQRLRLEWQVSSGLTLVLTQNGDDSYSADARWESSF